MCGSWPTLPPKPPCPPSSLPEIKTQVRRKSGQVRHCGTTRSGTNTDGCWHLISQSTISLVFISSTADKRYMEVRPQYIPDMRRCSVTAYSAPPSRTRHSLCNVNMRARRCIFGYARTKGIPFFLQSNDIFAVELDVKLSCVAVLVSTRPLPRLIVAHSTRIVSRPFQILTKTCVVLPQRLYNCGSRPPPDRQVMSGETEQCFARAESAPMAPGATEDSGFCGQPGHGNFEAKMYCKSCGVRYCNKCTHLHLGHSSEDASGFNRVVSAPSTDPRQSTERNGFNDQMAQFRRTTSASSQAAEVASRNHMPVDMLFGAELNVSLWFCTGHLQRAIALANGLRRRLSTSIVSSDKTISSAKR